MRNFKYTIAGYFVFLLTIMVNVAIGIMVYTKVETLGEIITAIAILGMIMFSAVICSIIDYVRRKLTVDKPLIEILNATRQMARGNFNIHLAPLRSYENFTEFDHIKDDLNKMAQALSKNEILKNDFIANVSHEIKTPLAVIQNYAKALNNPSLDGDLRKKYLENLQDACQRLSTLVMNILKLNKLENQKLNPEIVRFNLSELLANQILQFEEMITSKDINLQCDIEEDLYISSEESYLEIVFNNLISNAIKFTNAQGNIMISLHRDEDDYIIIVKDDGCGMDQETGKHIFEKFYQGDTSHAKEGNGLGLALVKKVIDILGGKINIESELGVGTTFVVTIKEVK